MKYAGHPIEFLDSHPDEVIFQVVSGALSGTKVIISSIMVLDNIQFNNNSSINLTINMDYTILAGENSEELARLCEMIIEAKLNSGDLEITQHQSN